MPKIQSKHSRSSASMAQSAEMRTARVKAIKRAVTSKAVPCPFKPCHALISRHADLDRHYLLHANEDEKTRCQIYRCLESECTKGYASNQYGNLHTHYKKVHKKPAPTNDKRKRDEIKAVIHDIIARLTREQGQTSSTSAAPGEPVISPKAGLSSPSPTRPQNLSWSQTVPGLDRELSGLNEPDALSHWQFSASSSIPPPSDFQQGINHPPFSNSFHSSHTLPQNFQPFFQQAGNLPNFSMSKNDASNMWASTPLSDNQHQLFLPTYPDTESYFFDLPQLDSLEFVPFP